MFFADKFQQLQNTQPNHLAITFEDQKINYNDLMNRSWQVANGLLSLGIERQDRVAHLAKNSPEFFEIFIGASASALATAGVNWRLVGPEILQILNATENSVLFVGKEFYSIIESIENELKFIKHIIAIDGDHDRWIDYAPWRDGQVNTRPDVVLDGDDDVLQLYTSGTTGLPKGVQLTNQGYVNTLNAVINNDIIAVGPDNTFVNVMPLFHVGGINLTVVPLLCGAHVHLQAEFDATRVLDTLANEKITHALFVPAMIQMLLQEPKVRERDYSHLERLYYGASPISESVLVEAGEVFGCGFMQLYGATENYGLISSLAPEDHAPERNKLRSCGKPVLGSEVKIIDEEGNALPNGEVGEILFKSDWVLKSYWRNPKATEEAKAGGWYHTGDAAYLDDEGFLFIKDRVKDMIITGGENVYPAEVENAVHSHDDIIDVAVIGIPDEQWGEAIKACVVLRPGAELSEEEIITYARTQIAGFKAPKSIDFIPELPRNPSGKILRRELRAPYWADQSRGV
ncbi:MAG: long-chain-fatty-acid--CoA ligase [Candidatus Reddybacter sp.]